MTVKIGYIAFGNDLPFALIAGPCQIESKAHAFEMATALWEVTKRHNIGLVYKSSFDKANRTSLYGVRGPGLVGCEILAAVRSSFGIPTITDVHEPWQCREVVRIGKVAALQIPAFLCRQTDLLIAAGLTGLPVNIKKGQFLAPQDIGYVVGKVADYHPGQVLLTERGTTFGYRDLVVDMRSIPIMRRHVNCPVIFDATHSVQQPGVNSGSTGGQREFVAPLARAAVAVGVAGLFIEVHNDPDAAPSDGANMITIKALDALLGELVQIDAVVKR